MHKPLGKLARPSAARRLTMLSSLFLVPQVWAQTAPADTGEAEKVVVTGTLLRGIAPIGTNAIGISKGDLAAAGKLSTNDLIASIPQASSFNTIPSSPGTNAPGFRPNLRGLGGAGSNTTLILVDGHRLVGQGVNSSYADPLVVPAGVLQRVEVIADGGSSIYGSDAIGGVINFITRKRFDGAEISGHFGAASAYRTGDLNLTYGRDWETGSAALSYSYAKHNNITGADRDFITSNFTAKGGTDSRSTACSPGNVTVAGVSYALPGRVAGTSNRCDLSDAVDYYPREFRHNLFGLYTQDFSETLKLDVKGYFSQRETRTLGSQTTTSGTITSSNPYFSPIGTETSQSVVFGYANPLGASTVSTGLFRSYGVTPVLTMEVGPSWELRAQANLGRSYNEIHTGGLNAVAAGTALAGTTLATALNPYQPAASNAAVLAGIENYEDSYKTVQTLAELRVIADGDLAKLPGGTLRVAVGAELHREGLDPLVYTGKRGADATQVPTASSIKRTVNSVFGEVLIPVIGKSNAMSALRAFDISASARYDRYSDFGSTTNPKVGFNYKPVDALVIRGNYGTSFNAPSLADTGNIGDTRAQINPALPPTVRPGDPANSAGRARILFAGSNPTLQPEKADTKSFGLDWTPLPGLNVSLTRWDILYKDQVGAAPFFNANALFAGTAWQPYYIINPSLAQLQAIFNGIRIDGPSLDSLYANGQSPYIYIDARRNNLQTVKLRGVDFNFSYGTNTSLGRVDAGLGGTYLISRRSTPVQGATEVDNLAGGTSASGPRRLTYVASLGLQQGAWTARASVNYLGGFHVQNVVGQSDVAAFRTLALFGSYDLGKAGLMKDAVASLNIDNVGNSSPGAFNGNAGSSTAGIGNGSTFGRLVTLGVQKRF